MAAEQSSSLEESQPLELSFSDFGELNSFVNILSDRFKAFSEKHKHNDAYRAIISLIEKFDEGSLSVYHIADIFQGNVPLDPANPNDFFNSQHLLFLLKNSFERITQTPKKTSISAHATTGDLNLSDPENAVKVSHNYVNPEEEDVYQSKVNDEYCNISLLISFWFIFQDPLFRHRIAPTFTPQEPFFVDHVHTPFVENHTLDIYSDVKNPQHLVGKLDLDRNLYIPKKCPQDITLRFSWAFFGSRRESGRFLSSLAIIVVKPYLDAQNRKQYKMKKITHNFSVYDDKRNPLFREDREEYDLLTGTHIEIEQHSQTFKERMNRFLFDIISKNVFSEHPMTLSELQVEKVKRNWEIDWFKDRKMSLFYLLSAMVEEWFKFQKRKLSHKKVISARTRITKAAQSLQKPSSSVPKQIKQKKNIFPISRADYYANEIKIMFTFTFFSGENENRTPINLETFISDKISLKGFFKTIERDFKARATTFRTDLFMKWSNELSELRDLESNYGLSTAHEWKEFSSFFLDYYNAAGYEDIIEEMQHYQGLRNINKIIEFNADYVSYEEKMNYLTFDDSEPALKPIMNTTTNLEYYNAITFNYIKRIILRLAYLRHFLKTYVQSEQDPYSYFSASKMFKTATKNEFPFRK